MSRTRHGGKSGPPSAARSRPRTRFPITAADDGSVVVSGTARGIGKDTALPSSL